MPRVLLRFLSEKDMVSGIIRWFTESPFAHVEFLLDEDWMPYLTADQKSILPTGDYGTLGAHFEGGIKVRPTDYGQFSNTETNYIDVTPEQKQAVIKAAVSAIGTPYDVVDILGLVFRQNWKDKGHEICSVYVTSVLVNSGVPLLRVSQNLPSITPRDVYLSPLPKPLS